MENLKEVIRKIPGFRSNTSWKMTLAIVVYSVLIFSLGVCEEWYITLGILAMFLVGAYANDVFIKKEKKEIKMLLFSIILFSIAIAYTPETTESSDIAIKNNTYIEKDASETTLSKNSITNDKEDIELNTKTIEDNDSGSEEVKLYKVTRVKDGDTIVVEIDGKNETVRLIGIDTEETVHPDAERNNNEYGKAASDFTKKNLTEKEVRLELDVQERDRYGRLLAYVYLDDVMFNKTLLKEGLARVATYPPNTRYLDEFEEIQREAKENKMGVWTEVEIKQEPIKSEEIKQNKTSNTNQATYKYIGNKNSMKLHEAICRWGKKTSEHNREYFDNSQNAFDKGYIRCKVCYPN